MTFLCSFQFVWNNLNMKCYRVNLVKKMNVSFRSLYRPFDRPILQYTSHSSRRSSSCVTVFTAIDQWSTDKAHAHIFQTPSTPNYEILFRHQPKSRCQGFKTTGTKNRSFQEGFTGKSFPWYFHFLSKPRGF